MDRRQQQEMLSSPLQPSDADHSDPPQINSEQLHDLQHEPVPQEHPSPSFQQPTEHGFYPLETNSQQRVGMPEEQRTRSLQSSMQHRARAIHTNGHSQYPIQGPQEPQAALTQLSIEHRGIPSLSSSQQLGQRPAGQRSLPLHPFTGFNSVPEYAMVQNHSQIPQELPRHAGYHSHQSLPMHGNVRQYNGQQGQAYSSSSTYVVHQPSIAPTPSPLGQAYRAQRRPTMSTQAADPGEGNDLAFFDYDMGDAHNSGHQPTQLNAYHQLAHPVLGSSPGLNDQHAYAATSPWSHTSHAVTTPSTGSTRHYNDVAIHNNAGHTTGFQAGGIGSQQSLAALSGASSRPPFDSNTSANNIPTGNQPPSTQLDSQQLSALTPQPANNNPNAGQPQNTGRRARLRPATRAGVQRWSARELHHAQQLHLAGYTMREIAEILHRTESSVTGKLWRETPGNDPHKSDKRRRGGGGAA